MQSDVAQRLEEFLRSHKISQKEFCDKLNYNQANLSSFINGRTNNPRMELIEGIANHYPEIDLVWLLTGSGKMVRDQSVVEAEKTTLADLRSAEEAEDKNQPITRKEIITLLMKRVNELEREIARKDPELAKELGIDERM